jgi:hypothetical protein
MPVLQHSPHLLIDPLPDRVPAIFASNQGGGEKCGIARPERPVQGQLPSQRLDLDRGRRLVAVSEQKLRGVPWRQGEQSERRHRDYGQDNYEPHDAEEK